MTTISTLFLLAGLLLFISVLASTVSARLGLPLLLLFLCVGMLAGEDGPGGILFSDFFTANFVGQLALAVILLDGGLRTDAASFRVALKPAAVLATWGVIGTVALLGVFATWVLDVDWRLGLLLAAIVGSTDAAAVFALLRHSGVRLNERVKSTLEIESGSNDPMAILLVTVLVEMLLHPERAGVAAFAVLLLKQAGIGLLFGLVGGKILAALLRRLNLAEGMYALLILSGGLLIVGAANLLDGSGLLAVYIAGVIVGNRRSHATEHVLRVMDGLAWLAQAGMFVVLGLLVTPSHLAEHAWEALAMALFLMLVARPLAVMIGLLPFRYARNEVAFVSWVGLRGAVPVVLAIFPVVMGVPDSRLLFDVAFSVVLLSLLVQGATIPAAARLLKVELPPSDEPHDRRELWVGEEAALPLFEYRVAAGSAGGGSPPPTIWRRSSRPAKCAASPRCVTANRSRWGPNCACVPVTVSGSWRRNRPSSGWRGFSARHRWIWGATPVSSASSSSPRIASPAISPRLTVSRWPTARPGGGSMSFCSSASGARRWSATGSASAASCWWFAPWRKMAGSPRSA